MLWIAGGLASRAGGHTQIGQIWSAPWPGPGGLAGCRDHPISRIRIDVSRHRTGPGSARDPAGAVTQARDGTSLLRRTAVCGHDEGYPRTFSRTCFRVRRFSATADLTFGIASGPSSRSEADVGWRSHLLVSVVPLAAGSSR